MVFALAGDSTITSVPVRGRLAFGLSPTSFAAATTPSSSSSSPSSSSGSCVFFGAALATSGLAFAAGLALAATFAFAAGFFAAASSATASSPAAAAFTFSLVGFLAGTDAFAAGAFLVATMHLESAAGAAKNPTFQLALAQETQHLAEPPSESNGHLFGGQRPLIEQAPQSHRVLRV